MLLTSVRDWTSRCRRYVLNLTLRKLVTSPVAAQSFSPRSTQDPVSGSVSNTGTTMTVGSLGISLYTVEEMTSTLMPVFVVQMSPGVGIGSTQGLFASTLSLGRLDRTWCRRRCRTR